MKKTDRNSILRHLSLLEANDINISVTAREIGKDRSTIYRWKKIYWQEYLNNKSKVKEQIHEIQAIKLSTIDGLNEIKNMLSDTLKIALKKVQDILNDPKKSDTLKHNDLIQLINVITPYAAEKMGVMGTGDPENNTIGKNHTTFVQNIIKEMSIHKYKKLKDNYSTKDKI